MWNSRVENVRCSQTDQLMLCYFDRRKAEAAASRWNTHSLKSVTDRGPTIQRICAGSGEHSSSVMEEESRMAENSLYRQIIIIKNLYQSGAKWD